MAALANRIPQSIWEALDDGDNLIAPLVRGNAAEILHHSGLLTLPSCMPAVEDRRLVGESAWLQLHCAHVPEGIAKDDLLFEAVNHRGHLRLHKRQLPANAGTYQVLSS